MVEGWTLDQSDKGNEKADERDLDLTVKCAKYVNLLKKGTTSINPLCSGKCAERAEHNEPERGFAAVKAYEP